MSREVELIIRAKDEASKFVDSISDSLKQLTGVQEDVGKSAQKTGGLLDQLGKEFRDLNDEAKRLSSLDKVAQGLEKSNAAVKQLGNTLGSAASDFAALSRESENASRAADRLRNSLETEEAALKASKDARKQATAELREANKALAEAEKNQRDLNRATKVKAPAGATAVQLPFSNAEAINSARALQVRLKEDIAGYTAEVKRSSEAVDSLKPQVQAAARQQAALAEQTERASGSLSKNLDTLERARGEFTGLKNAADQASVAMGGIAVTQDDVAKASARVAAELARTKAQIEGISKAPKITAGGADISSDTKDADARRVAILRLRDLSKELASAQADAQRLNSTLRSSAAPTAELGTAAGQAQTRVRDLKGELTDLRTRLRASEGGFRSWSEAASTLRSSTTGASTAAANLASTSGQAAAAIRPLGSAAQSAGQGMSNAASGGKGLRDALNGIYGDSRKALSLMQRLRGEVLSLTAGYLGLQAAISNIGGVVKSFQTLEAAQNRLGSVFNQDTGRVTQELEFLQRQADRLGIQFGLLSDQYAKFSIAAKAANFQTEATRKIFLSVAEAGRVNKLSTEQLEGVFLALEQMISKGKVSSEELRRQLGDRLPGAFNIFADAIGVSTSQLDEMMRKGEVLSTQSNLLKFADQLDKRFGSQLSSALQSTTSELGRFSNNLFEAQLQVAQGGFIDGFTEALRKLNSYFQSREGRDFFLSLGAALGKFASALAELPPYFEQIKIGLEVFAAVKIAGVLSNLIASLRTAATAAGLFGQQISLIGPQTHAFVQNQTAISRALTLGVGRLDAWRSSLGGASTGLRALGVGLGGLRTVVIAMTGLFRGLWAAVGGIPGIILTGITIAIGQWATQIDTATSALDEHQRQMQLITKAYDEAKNKAQDWSLAVKGVTISQAEDNLSKLLDAYNEKFDQLAGQAGNVRKVVEGIQNSKNGFGSGVDKKDLAEVQNLLALLDQLQQRKITLDQFRAGLDQIARSTKQEGLKALAVDMQNFLDAADDKNQSITNLADAIEHAQAKLRLLKGEATDADKVLLGYKDSTGQAKDATSELGENATKINDAFDEMGKSISKTSDELKRLETIDGLNKQYQDAIKLARTMGQVNLLTEQYGKALDGALDQSINANSGIVDRIIGVESGGNAAAENKDSSATGLGQFIESTWLRMFKQYFPDRAAGLSDAMILELRKNAEVSRQMVSLYVQENAKILQKAGVAVTDANLYLAHFLGPDGATKVLQAQAGTKLSDILSSDAVNANPTVLGDGKTVEDLVAWAQKKVGVSKEEITIQKELAEQDQKRSDRAKEYNDDLNQRLSLQENENANAGKLTKEAFIQKAVYDEQERAKKAGVTLDTQRIEQIKAAAAAEWEVKNAKTEGKNETQAANVALQQAVALAQQRNALQQSFNQAQKMGDITQATSLQSQLNDVNSRLQEAIEKAQGMWQAIGGPEADVALTKLDTLQVKAQTSANSLSLLGLSTQQVGQLAGSFADGLVGVFDSFAQAIANGENAVQALGKAFLQFAANFLREIAQMILKQLILNALQSFGIPGLGGATAHTGGVVGAGLVGVGNSKRQVSPAIFANAMRYHTGGIAGLRPDEVPTILKQNEEVLTEDDPRHRNNGGLNPQSSSRPGGSDPQAIRVINVLDDETAEQMMNSATGERVFIAHAKKNRATLRTVLGI